MKQLTFEQFMRRMSMKYTLALMQAPAKLVENKDDGLPFGMEG
jgi:hypothetical protein